MRDPKTLNKGTVLIHRYGGVVVLDRRKEDDTGWWVFGGGGLDDRFAESNDWMLPSQRMLAALFQIWSAEVEISTMPPARVIQ